MIPSIASFPGAQKRILFTLAAVWLTGHCFAQTAAFTSDKTSGCFPVTINFKDLSTGSPTTWDWNLGNGNTSKLQNPSAVYAGPGTYTVTLRVSGGSESVRTAYIHVYDFPTPSFTSVAPPTGCTPLKVEFRDTSTPGSGANTNWLWTFGDGSSSTERNPTYTYTAPGTRPVSVRVTNQYGCSKTSLQTFVAEARGPNVAFEVDEDVFCQAPATVKFTNKTNGAAPFTYSWDFNDGTSSAAISPSHPFTKEGAYKVTLRATDANGCQGTSTTAVINVGSEGGLSVTPSATKVCVGQALTFDANVTSPAISWVWRFGNGAVSHEQDPGTIVYKTEGTYTVRLEALLVGKSCASVVTQTIEVVPDPVPNFTTSADCNYKVTFTNRSTKATRVEWFLDGTLYSTASSFAYPYAGPGNYTVKLVAYNSLNCSKELEMPVSVPAKPQAYFEPNKTQSCTEPSLAGCAPFTVNFINKSTSSSSFTSQWSFGDNTTSSSKNPTHTYGKGSYAVKLTIRTPEGCTSTMSAAVTVSDVTPEAAFTFDRSKVCPHEDVNFTSTSKNAVFICWDFGDGNTGNGPNVSHYYEKPGTYTITMIAKNAGCSDTETKANVITVGDPLVDFKITKDCQDPYKVTIEDLTSKCDTKTWDFGDGTIKTGNVASYRYAATGEYTIKLTGTNNTSHCTVDKPVPVAIHEVKASFTIDNLRPCKNAPVKFESTSQGAASLNWDFGNGAPAQSGIQASASYDHHDEFKVTLTAKDPDGCPAVAELLVSVLNLEGNFNFIASGVSCDALAVQFNDASTANPPVDTWTWDFGDGNTAIGPNPAHTYTQLGNYPVKLTLTNADGQCSFIRYDAVVFTNPIPDFTTSTGKFGFCKFDQIQLVNLSQYTTSQRWDLSPSTPSTTMHPVISYPNKGSYVVKLDVEDGYGCKKSVSKSIEITKPEADFTAANVFTECPDPPLLSEFTDTSEGDIKKWEWDFGNGQIQPHENRAPGETYLYSYTRPGIFDITLFTTDANGCRDTVTHDALVRVGGPDATFEDDKFGLTCVMDSIGFVATPLNDAVKIYRWDFGDGNVVDLGVPTVGHAYTGTGDRIVSLVLFDDKNCKVISASTVKVTVSDSSLIKFDYGPRCIFEGESFTLRAESDDQDLTWSWDVGDNPVGTDAEATITTEKHGNYPVKLRALNAAGCTSTVTQEVPVRAKLTMIPNIFTPNGDGTNETFELQGLENSAWDLLVYNRWGGTVYKKKNYQNNWTGGGLSSGVYFYTVTNAFCPDRNYKGTVTISK
ncbi:PKD domain-containing protein [Parachryseolinea silvisoli]|uniref:PKD domain-containing protein n=1 Tax=Parachryseolinea silvisoli TaxID=2873601 RepID=UPI0022658F8F|nr:PKD domain-containing protein [Parachryseolinea silvisoli]MCD9019410.1 PKD domain-containing protein [Parachryseolinea silvisoli]